MPPRNFAEGDFASFAVEAEPGSLFALYTDGFVETANAAGEEFGIQRLQAEFQKERKQAPRRLHTHSSPAFASTATQFDDQSALLIRRLVS